MSTKICSKCGEAKPATDFYSRAGRKPGATRVSGHCKTCHLKTCADRYAAKKNIILKSQKNYYQENKGRILEAGKDYRERNAETIRERRLKKRESRMENCKAWRERNRAACLEYDRAYKKENRDAIRNKRLSASDEQKDRVRLLKRKRRSNTVNGERALRLEGLLTVDDKAFINANTLHVHCAYCGASFTPDLKTVENRVSSLAGIQSGERRMYCSAGCKKACPIYRKVKYPLGFKVSSSREVQPELRRLVLARDGHRCQSCGGGVECSLHAHHIDPVAENPVESADVDNCITLCKVCHKQAHSKPGCRTWELGKCA